MRIAKPVFLWLLLLTLLLNACAASGNSAASNSSGAATRPEVDGKSVSVVATVFPAYDWARQIIGTRDEQVALTLLMDKGSDLHSYQPTVEDIYKISTCDLFIYVGGESDRWVPDALKQASNPNMITICLMDVLGEAVKEEETIEGMEADHDHDHDDDHDDHDHDHDDDHDDHDHEHDDGPEYDEHVWLSLRHVQTLCAAIRDGLNACDPSGKADYDANCTAYNGKLAALDRSFAELVDHAERTTLLFADRFPFRYFTDDYGLTYYAAFQGCSAETEASFETVNFLVSKVDELKLPYIIVLEQSDRSLADTIIENTEARSAQVLELDSLQSVTAQGVEAGVSYLGVMERNLETIKTALGTREP